MTEGKHSQANLCPPGHGSPRLLSEGNAGGTAPLPLALRSQLPTRCHSRSWRSGSSSEECSPATATFLNLVSCSTLALLQGPASRKEALSGGWGSWAPSRGGGSGVTVTAGCRSKAPSRGGDGEEGMGRRPFPRSAAAPTLPEGHALRW